MPPEPEPPPPTVAAVRALLARELGPPVDGDVRLTWRRSGPAGAPVQRLVLAPEWRPEHAALARPGDAWFLHRPWRLPPDQPGGAVGVFSSHAAFDSRLSVGPSVALASRLGLTGGESVFRRPGDPLPIGVVADDAPGAPRGAAEWRALLRAEFGGADEELPGDEPDAPVCRVALMGAMDGTLVQECVRRGAGLYVTGAMRVPGRDAARSLGLPVIAVGHSRSEMWGLRHLSRVAAGRLPGLKAVVVLP